jgi:hypothetical protein
VNFGFIASAGEYQLHPGGGAVRIEAQPARAYCRNRLGLWYVWIWLHWEVGFCPKNALALSSRIARTSLLQTASSFLYEKAASNVATSLAMNARLHLRTAAGGLDR